MKTVGLVLRDARQKKGITFQEAERATKIRSETLQALEEDNFSNLPAPTYIKGFITLYGDFLGLDTTSLLAIFRRQYDDKKDKPSVILPDLSPKEGRKWRLTPGKLFGIGVSVLVAGFLGYLLLQYQSFAAAPLLEVKSPADFSKVNNGTVEVVGRTDRDAKLTINGQVVELTPSGAFSVSVTLPDGTTDLTLSAVNKLGRVTTVKRTITVETAVASSPIGPSASSSAQLAGAMQFSLKIGPSLAHVEVKVDDQPPYILYLSGGTTRTFVVQNKVVVRTYNAGSTDVIINGADQGKMGSEGEDVTKTYNRTQ